MARIVLTPGGLAARQCVHQVSNGGTIVEDDAGNTLVIVNGQVVESFPPCPCASPRRAVPVPVSKVDASEEDGAAEQ